MKMKQPLVVAMLTRDAVEQLPIVVGLHEVPVLAAVHPGPGGDGTRISVDEAADLPAGLTEVEFDPEEEFDALALKYGRQPGSGTPFVVVAYGSRAGFLEAVGAEAATSAEAPARRGRGKAAASAEG